MCQSNIQERQETGSWRNSTEWWPSDSRPLPGRTYKYLEMEEGEWVQHHKVKVKIKKEYK